MSREPASKSPPSQPERIQKVLAKAGLGSRREIESWISAGRITVNGKPAKLGDSLRLTDRVKVDKRNIKLKASISQSTRILAYYKPVGQVCTRKDPQGVGYLSAGWISTPRD